MEESARRLTISNISFSHNLFSRIAFYSLQATGNSQYSPPPNCRVASPKTCQKSSLISSWFSAGKQTSKQANVCVKQQVGNSISCPFSNVFASPHENCNYWNRQTLWQKAISLCSCTFKKFRCENQNTFLLTSSKQIPYSTFYLREISPPQHVRK